MEHRSYRVRAPKPPNPEGSVSEAQTKCDCQSRTERETADEAEMRALESTGYQKRYGTGGPMRHLIADKP